MGEMHSFSSGAKSTIKMPDFTKCPREAVDAIVNRFDYGEAKGYVWEWKNGLRGNYQNGLNDPDFVRDRYNHCINHLLNLKQPGGTIEDLEAAICNLAMLCWLSKNGSAWTKVFPHLDQLANANEGVE